MPLKSANEPGIDRGDYIEFVMLDGTRPVACRVSEEAIDDIEGGRNLQTNARAAVSDSRPERRPSWLNRRRCSMSSNR